MAAEYLTEVKARQPVGPYRLCGYSFGARQLAELAWEIPCSHCGAMPEGPVLRDAIETVEFRCPFRTCEDKRSTGVLVNLNLNLVNQGLSRFHGDINELLQQALADLPSEAAIGVHGLENAESMRQFPIRLTRTQYYLYGRLGLPRLSRIANAGLRRILGRERQWAK
jgi:hypothetical protein